MLKTFSLVCLGFIVSSVLGCAADVAPSSTGDHGPALAEQTAEGQSFEVQLSHDVTAETVIPAIVFAGHAELAAALFATYAVCPRATNPRDEKHCGYLTNGGFTALGVTCAFM